MKLAPSLLVLLIAAGAGAGAPAAEAPAASWPTYRADNARSGVTQQRLKLPVREVWRYKLPLPPEPAWPPPAKHDFWHNKYGLSPRVTFDRANHVVSDGRVVLLGSSADDQLRCLDLATGRLLWRFYAEGPIRLAPSLAGGRAYFGSDDGAAYCVSLADGRLVWKFRGPPAPRRIPGNGRIISTWPIRTGLLVEGGQVRFAAGLFPTQGVEQFTLDAATGKVLARGPLKFSPQGYLKLADGRLSAPRGRAPQAELERRAAGKGPAAKTPTSPEKEYSLHVIATPELVFGGGEGRVKVYERNSGRPLSNSRRKPPAMLVSTHSRRKPPAMLVSTH